MTVPLEDTWPNFTNCLKCCLGHDVITSMICKLFNCFMSNIVRDISQSTSAASCRKITKLWILKGGIIF